MSTTDGLQWMTLEEITAAATTAPTADRPVAPTPPANPHFETVPTPNPAASPQAPPAAPAAPAAPPAPPAAQPRQAPTPPTHPQPAATPPRTAVPVAPAQPQPPPAAAPPPVAPLTLPAPRRSPERPGVTSAGAASQITELLQAAHDTAERLRTNAEAEIRRSVDAARAQVESHKQNQLRALNAEQAAAEQLHAEIVHNARLAAVEVKARAEEEAAEIKAAADAVLAQAAAHAQAAQALVQHNLAELEAFKDATAERSLELISAGEQMILSVQDLDDHLSDRLIHTDRLIDRAHATLTPRAS